MCSTASLLFFITSKKGDFCFQSGTTRSPSLSLSLSLSTRARTLTLSLSLSSPLSSTTTAFCRVVVVVVVVVVLWGYIEEDSTMIRQKGTFTSTTTNSKTFTPTLYVHNRRQKEKNYHQSTFSPKKKKKEREEISLVLFWTHTHNIWTKKRHRRRPYFYLSVCLSFFFSSVNKQTFVQKKKIIIFCLSPCVVSHDHDDTKTCRYVVFTKIVFASIDRRHRPSSCPRRSSARKPARARKRVSAGPFFGECTTATKVSGVFASTCFKGYIKGGLFLSLSLSLSLSLTHSLTLSFSGLATTTGRKNPDSNKCKRESICAGCRMAE